MRNSEKRTLSIQIIHWRTICGEKTSFLYHMLKFYISVQLLENKAAINESLIIERLSSVTDYFKSTLLITSLHIFKHLNSY